MEIQLLLLNFIFVLVDFVMVLVRLYYIKKQKEVGIFEPVGVFTPLIAFFICEFILDRVRLYLNIMEFILSSC